MERSDALVELLEYSQLVKERLETERAKSVVSLAKIKLLSDISMALVDLKERERNKNEKVSFTRN